MRIRKAQIRQMTRGAISLLLVLVMSPMLSIALTLVESARYQDAEATMNEIIDISGFSTIADYDEYLDERFNLMCVSQETAYKTAFDGYLDDNIKSMGAAVTVNNTTLGGEYPLSDVDVLRQQIWEYGELSVPMEEMFDGADIKETFDQLVKQKDGLEAVKNFANSTSAAANAVDEVADIVKAMATVVSNFEALETAQTEAATAYSEFQQAILSYGSTVDSAMSSKMLEVHKPSLTDSEKNEVMSSSAVTTAWSNVISKRDAYSTKLENWEEKLKTAADFFDEFLDSVNKVSEKVGTAKHDASNGLKKLQGEDTNKGIDDLDKTDLALIVINKILDTINKNQGDDLRNKAQQDLQMLGNVRTTLTKVTQGTVSISWTSEDVDKIYKIDDKSITVVGSFWKTIWNDLKEDFDSVKGIPDAAVEPFSALIEIYNSMLGVSFVYDTSLNAQVDESLLIKDVSPNFSSGSIIRCMNDVSSAIDDIKSAEGLIGVVKILKACAKLLLAIANFLLAVVEWALLFFYNLFDVGVSIYSEGGLQNLILYGYGVYNMPNRTNITDKSMTGYKYTKLFQMAGGNLSDYHNAFSGTFDSITGETSGSGRDELFKGAEAEYLIAGSTDEIQNQAIVFFDLYMLRLVLDLIPIFKNENIRNIADFMGTLGWVAYIVEIIAEPFLETFLLVNGSDAVYLINSPIYLTPVMFPRLIAELPKIGGLPKNTETALKDATKKWVDDKGTDKVEGAIGKAKYTEHLLILTLCCVTESDYVARLQNLIQLEGKASHKEEYEFDLTKTYTFVTAEVDYQLNPMFNLDGITNGRSLHKIHKKRYVGY